MRILKVIHFKSSKMQTSFFIEPIYVWPWIDLLIFRSALAMLFTIFFHSSLSLWKERFKRKKIFWTVSLWNTSLWNTTIEFLIISGWIRVNLLNVFNIRSEIWRLLFPVAFKRPPLYCGLLISFKIAYSKVLLSPF